MTIEVETGQASPTSASYASVADADAHFASRGITTWTEMLEAEKEQALVRATDYMGEVYRMLWSGYRVKPEQSLDWPRYDVRQIDAVGPDGYGGVPFYSPNVVPREIKRACIELSLRAAAGELAPDLDPFIQSETVGPITTTYAAGQSRHKRYPAIERLLAPFLAKSGGLKLIRA